MTSLDLARLGVVTLDPPGSVVAGQVGSWRLEYEVGPYGVDEGGTIKIAQRFASDWEVPQFTDPAAAGYTAVSTTGDAQLAVRYDPKGHERPWMKCIVIDVYDGSLVPGDVVTTTMGDRSGGSPGIRAQTFLESRHEFRVLVDPTNACLARRIPSSPGFAIVPAQPVRIVCILPTTSQADRPVEVFIKAEDGWGNPTNLPEGIELRWDGSVGAKIDGRHLTVGGVGEGRILAHWRGRFYPSNPTASTVDPPRWRHFWGDLHAQSDATVGTGDEVEYFTFARDKARLDFASHQGNDFQMTDEDWTRLNHVIAQFNDEGRFVVFPGFEWSGNSSAGGDRNVFYLEEGHPIIRSSHWQIPDVPADERTPAHSVDELFRRLRNTVDPTKVLLGSHVGGRYANIRKPEFFDEELGPLIEVASCWGVFEWLLWDAFDQGYTVGVMCNSDGHKGRPGAEGPGAGQFGIGGGLTCVLASELTRSSVFEALRARRCYGTTGPRIALWFTANGNPMGSRVDTSGPVQIRARCIASDVVEAVQLFCRDQLIAEAQPEAFGSTRASTRIRVSWAGARIRGRGRRVTWDGALRLEGNRVVKAETFAFDSPADGIVQLDDDVVRFRSRTTGDADGIDLWIDDANAGTLAFDSPAGSTTVALSELRDTPRRRDFGGLGMHVLIRRYPERLEERTLRLEETVSPPQGQVTPYLVKVVQADGHLAWSSPVYLGTGPPLDRPRLTG